VPLRAQAALHVDGPMDRWATRGYCSLQAGINGIG
jgi:hypothetical protein